MKRFILLFSFSFFTSALSLAQDEIPQLAVGISVTQELFSSSANPEVSCYRIPALITAPNGDLVVAIDERVPSCQDLRGSRDINIVIRRSSDLGNSWTAIERIVDFPQGQSASDPSMIVDRETGDIFLFYNYMDLDNQKDIYYLHMIKSRDNGLSWSEPMDITQQITKDEWHSDFKFITSGRGIQTSTGKLIHCLVNLDHGMHLFASDDHGKSWQLIDTPIKPANESKVVELADGRWMVNSRVNKKGKRWVHLSSDQGKNWESRADPALIDPGCNGSIIRYTSVEEGSDKNRLLFSNPKHKKGRTHLAVRISYDEGETWSEGKTIYPGGSAYSSLTILENGDIGLVFEKDFYTENPFISFSLEWLTEGEDKIKEP
jgi:sialidase-1